ncbi:MAG: hypothetical protein EBS99_13200, partial [Betaproteobacteria bacterium]|nr:hypothetical protein [Betaproteobacteria bacterium]
MNAASKALIKKYCPEIFLRFYWFYRVAQFRLLRFVPRYDEDELITAHKCDFVNDPHFKACYDGAVRDGLAIPVEEDHDVDAVVDCPLIA